MSRAERAFKRWMKANGIDYSDALELCIGHGFSVSGSGVRALCDLKEGDLIATIPHKACLTIRTSATSPMIEEAGLGGTLGLAVALMYERSKGPSSPWYGYLQLLPHHECVPLVWSLDEVDTLLVGTELHKAVKEDMQFLQEDWEESIAPLVSSNPSEFPREWFSVEQFFAAKTLVESRAFQVDDYHGFGMVPLADLFNHKTAAEDVHFTSASHVDSSDVDHPGAFPIDDENSDDSYSEISDRVSSKEGDSSLYPGADGNEITDMKGTHLFSSSESNDNFLEMILVKNVKAGDEVFNTYGTLSNAALLHRYGFTEPENPFDIVNIDLDIVMDCCLLYFSSRYVRFRVAFWRRLGCVGCSSQDSEYFEVSASGKPQLELLMLLHIINLPDDLYQSLYYAAPQHSQSLDDAKKLLYITTNGFEAMHSHSKDTKKRPNHCIVPKGNKLGKGICTKKIKFGEDGNVGESDEWLLTSSVCQCLLLLADKRDRLYGSGSLNEDLEHLRTFLCAEHPKLFHALSLRVSERSILQRLRLYAGKACEGNKAKYKSCRKQI